MIRECCDPAGVLACVDARVQIRAVLALGAVAARGVHHEVIHHNEPVTATRCRDGPEGRPLGFRGAERPIAAVADEDGARSAARLGSEEYRVGGEPSGLDSAHGDDGMPDEAVAAVDVSVGQFRQTRTHRPGLKGAACLPAPVP